jgi:hypothetical protein
MPNYSKLLDRVPDATILAVATRDLDLESPNSCLCGSVVREYVGALQNIDPDYINVSDSGISMDADKACSKLFGGRTRDWRSMFFGVVDSRRLPLIELAFVRRIAKAVRRSK